MGLRKTKPPGTRVGRADRIERRMMAEEQKVTTLCENCQREVALEDTHSCPACGLDPLCGWCGCENCPGKDGG